MISRILLLTVSTVSLGCLTSCGLLQSLSRTVMGLPRSVLNSVTENVKPEVTNEPLPGEPLEQSEEATLVVTPLD